MKTAPKWLTYHVPGWLLGILLIAGITTCTGHFLSQPQKMEDISGPEFVMVTIRPGDSFPELARTHLGDHRKAWIIAAYNQLEAPVVGRQIVIPLTPQALGGLTPDGYQTVPVLYYPRIGHGAQEQPSLSAAAFSEQMQWLKDNGFVTISMDQMQAFLQFQDPLPPKSVILTFDTGQRWFYEIVFPILQRFGYTAALFIPTQSINRPDALAWSELALLAAAGFDIGTSGRSFRSLMQQPDTQKSEEWLKAVEAEIAGSAHSITTQLGTFCRFFAYPDGDTNDLLVAFLKQHDYMGAFTRRPGSNAFFADNYRLSRTTIAGDIDPVEFIDGLLVFQTADLR